MKSLYQTQRIESAKMSCLRVQLNMLENEKLLPAVRILIVDFESFSLFTHNMTKKKVKLSDQEHLCQLRSKLGDLSNQETAIKLETNRTLKNIKRLIKKTKFPTNNPYTLCIEESNSVEEAIADVFIDNNEQKSETLKEVVILNNDDINNDNTNYWNIAKLNENNHYKFTEDYLVNRIQSLHDEFTTFLARKNEVIIPNHIATAGLTGIKPSSSSTSTRMKTIINTLIEGESDLVSLCQTFLSHNPTPTSNNTASSEGASQANDKLTNLLDNYLQLSTSFHQILQHTLSTLSGRNLPTYSSSSITNPTEQSKTPYDDTAHYPVSMDIDIQPRDEVPTSSTATSAKPLFAPQSPHLFPLTQLTPPHRTYSPSPDTPNMPTNEIDNAYDVIDLTYSAHKPSLSPIFTASLSSHHHHHTTASLLEEKEQEEEEEEQEAMNRLVIEGGDANVSIETDQEEMIASTSNNNSERVNAFESYKYIASQPDYKRSNNKPPLVPVPSSDTVIRAEVSLLGFTSTTTSKKRKSSDVHTHNNGHNSNFPSVRPVIELTDLRSPVSNPRHQSSVETYDALSSPTEPPFHQYNTEYLNHVAAYYGLSTDHPTRVARLLRDMWRQAHSTASNSAAAFGRPSSSSSSSSAPRHARKRVSYSDQLVAAVVTSSDDDGEEEEEEEGKENNRARDNHSAPQNASTSSIVIGKPLSSSHLKSILSKLQPPVASPSAPSTTTLLHHTNTVAAAVKFSRVPHTASTTAMPKPGMGDSGTSPYISYRSLSQSTLPTPTLLPATTAHELTASILPSTANTTVTSSNGGDIADNSTDLKSKVINYITNNPLFYQQILTYTPINLDELHEQIKSNNSNNNTIHNNTNVLVHSNIIHNTNIHNNSVHNTAIHITKTQLREILDSLHVFVSYGNRDHNDAFYRNNNNDGNSNKRYKRGRK